ncbi:hypothetical protein ACSQ6I_23505 [Anabaena sp. WFMT]|uniref:hypothetical protein n=1 Tax=Anabaena sp. WFMT TaxID=3449730 RepID=UPI003F205DB8
MTTEQIQVLTNFETEFNSFLATLPNTDIKRTLSSAKKSLHSAICTALGDEDVDYPENPRGK